MRPVDVGPQAAPKPWWQRWGWSIYGGIIFLLLVVLQETVGLSFWAAVAISVGLALIGLVLESVLPRILSARRSFRR